MKRIIKFIENALWCSPDEKGAAAEILGEARRLASLEAKEKPTLLGCPVTYDDTLKPNEFRLEQKPTANADLVGEIEKYIKWHGNPEGEGGEPTTFTCEYDEFFDILSRYRPVPVVKEQGEAGLRVNCIHRTNCTLNSQTRICKEKFGIDSSPCPDDADENCTCPATPAPVASGLVEYLEYEIDLLKNGQSHVGPFQEGMTYAYENILSRYSKEAK